MKAAGFHRILGKAFRIGVILGIFSSENNVSGFYRHIMKCIHNLATQMA